MSVESSVSPMLIPQNWFVAEAEVPIDAFLRTVGTGDEHQESD